MLIRAGEHMVGTKAILRDSSSVRIGRSVGDCGRETSRIVKDLHGATRLPSRDAVAMKRTEKAKLWIAETGEVAAHLV